MKFIAYTISTLLALEAASAFVTKPTYASAKHLVVLNAVELEPEPEGGEELAAVDTMPGSRMKNMGEVEGVTNDDGTVYKFWMTASAEGELIKGINQKVLKESAKKANFPGFRKGQVPPYAMPQIRGFAVQDGILKTIESAAASYGLKSIPGSDGEVTVFEDIPEVAKTYKLGDSVEFTAGFNAIFDPEKLPKEEEEASEEEAAAEAA